jgi:hypothetical protein
MDDLTKSNHRLTFKLDREPTWIERKSIKPLSVAEEITSLSRDTLVRRYPEYVVQLSDKRRGMALEHILAIAAGKL